MSATADEFHKILTELENEGHHTADRLRAVFEKIFGRKPDAPAPVPAPEPVEPPVAA